MSKVHENSLRSVRIEVLAENTKAHLTWGSGFICRVNNKFYLVTNWHMVSGKNFQTNQTLHKSGAIPGFFNIKMVIAANKNESTLIPLKCEINNLELYDSKIENEEKVYTDKPLWLEHPTLGSRIDVAVLEITKKIEAVSKLDVIAFDLTKELEKEQNLNVMDDVFIVGYPLPANTTPNEFPIYKGATIASEPNLFGELPLFYVDGKTKTGMSGSPVIKRNKLEIFTTSGTLNWSDGRIDLIGVYSGRERQETDEYQAELGIVWKYEECLMPIIKEAGS